MSHGQKGEEGEKGVSERNRDMRNGEVEKERGREEKREREK